MITRVEERPGPIELPGVEEAQTLADLALVLRHLRRREARRRNGAELTYRQLAARAGWSHAIVAAYLTGKTLPPTNRFDTLVRLLGATPTEQGALATARDRVEEARRRPAPRSPAAPADRTDRLLDSLVELCQVALAILDELDHPGAGELRDRLCRLAPEVSAGPG